MKSFLKTVSRAVAALFAVALVTMGVASPAFADGAPRHDYYRIDHH